ncbi:hypothetical protein IWW48_003195 [Coemansia sp. RSA 1200]|nr:hypothetical protein IWW48_003195 [Coemansia sp. RSA 1200]
MLTSTFSHKELVHFAFNNIALASFGTVIASAMGPEQFTAFYLTAGVFSSFASQAFARVFPTLLIPSLGASGAVYGVVGATMLLYPNAPLAIILIPFVSFPISVLFPAMMAFDLIGLVRRWKGINHVAHLAGGLFGLAYVMWGKAVWTQLVQFQSARRAKKNAGRLN